MAKRLYETWKGKNKFLCSGRLIFGPDGRSVIVTTILIVSPSLVFYACVARHFFNRFSHHTGVWILIVSVVYLPCVLIFLLLTSARDPGIIPRSRHPPVIEEVDWIPGQGPRLKLPRTKDVIVNGVFIRVKYCDTCMLYRPPRCSHCSVCNNCVERFDHHCPWVGQCIGQRNYRYFFFFVSSATVLCVYVFAMCALYMKLLMDDSQCSVWRAMSKSPVSIVLMVYSFVCVWFVGGLTFFHLYLIGSNQTTYENFRSRYENKTNPYSMGVIRNLMDVFCGPIPPSKNDFRAPVVEEADEDVEDERSRGSSESSKATPWILPNDDALEEVQPGRGTENEEDSTEHDSGAEAGDLSYANSVHSSWDQSGSMDVASEATPSPW